MSKENTCGDCIENEDGFCDKIGIMVEDDDLACIRFKEDMKKEIEK